MLKKTKKWLGYNFNYGHYDNPPREGVGENDEMRQFFRDFRSDMKANLKNTGLKIYEMKKNYYDVTFIVSNEEETKFIYVSLGDMRYNPKWNVHILYRSMAHSKDWSGGSNYYANDIDDLVENMKIMMERSV